jgi:transcriptional regulator with XRE-family HTH domain
MTPDLVVFRKPAIVLRMSPQSWPEEQAARIAQEVRRLRRANGRSAQQLADQTTKIGYTVSRAVIADLENGRRRYVTTAELVVLAAALNTAPIALLYPPPLFDTEVEVLPGVEVKKLAAMQEFSFDYENRNESWIRGELRLDDAAMDEFWRNIEPLRRARMVRQLEGERQVYVESLADWGRKDAESKVDPATEEAFRQQVKRITEEINRLRTDDGG